MRNRSWLGLALFALLLGAVNFSASAADKIVVGFLRATGDAKYFVAYEKGYFAEEGLEVELVPFVNSADGLTAILAGKIDTGAFGTIAPLLHISKGTDVRILGGVMGEDASLITTPENAGKIKSVTDLKGKKIATVRLASGDAVLRGALHNAGLSWKTDVEIVELKSPVAVIEAVKGGDAEVGVVWGPLDLQAKKQGLRVVLTSRDLLPGHPCCRIAVTGENFNAKGAEVWKRFLRAVLKAERFARGSEANQQETVDIILKYAPLDRDIIENAYYHGILDQTTDPNLKGVKDIWDILVAAEYLEPGDNNPLAFIETEPYLKALAELQAAEPNDEFWKKTAVVVVPRNQGQAGGGKK